MEILLAKKVINNIEYKISEDEMKNYNGEIYYSCHIWVYNGGLVIAGGNYDSIQKFEAEMETAIKNWGNGLIRCSHCGAVEKFEDIQKNRYFAGIYCNKCWDSKFKQLEADETYN